MRNLLFTPGPTNVSDRVRRALISDDVFHREEEFSEILLSINRSLLRILKIEDLYDAILFGSSGTGCNEAIISSIHGKILLLNNGKYSARLGEIARRYHIPLVDFIIPPFEKFDLNAIEKELETDESITHVLLAHHETATGVVAPVADIGELTIKYNKILSIDAISSLGGHELNFKKSNIGFCSVTANKCLEGFPGVSFVIARKTELSKLKGKSRNFYLDLYEHWSKEKKGEVPFTPPIQIIYALKEALNCLEEEGLENRIKRYQHIYQKMKEGLTSLGFKVLDVTKGASSNIMILLEIPEKMNYWQVHDLLKDKGITIYSRDEVLQKGQFEIATMGCLTEEDIERFLVELKNIRLSCQF